MVNLNNAQLTSQEVMLGTLHGAAYWTLRAMDRQSTTEFINSTLSDYRNALFPALQHQGADTSKINLNGSGTSATGNIVDKAGIFITTNKTLLMILVAIAAIYVVVKVWNK